MFHNLAKLKGLILAGLGLEIDLSDAKARCSPPHRGSKSEILGLPWCSVAKTLSSQCRGRRFKPWSGNWIHVPELKSSHIATKTQRS